LPVKFLRRLPAVRGMAAARRPSHSRKAFVRRVRLIPLPLCGM
jgi:hypothetical protein